jgi:CxxC motif-containing protein
MKRYYVLGNYLSKNKTAYVPGWDYHFGESGKGLSTIMQVEDYTCSVLGDRSYDKALVKTGKAVARQVGIRVKDASAIIVEESTKNSIEQHFAPELNKSIWIVEAAK